MPYPELSEQPVGKRLFKVELEKIAEIAVKRDIFVISDEVYEKLVFEGEHVSIASLGEDIKKNTIVVNAVSKTYAMTGWRIGYLACDSSLAKLITAIQSHSTSNAASFSQYGTLAALEGGDDSVKKWFENFRKEDPSRFLYLMKCRAFLTLRPTARSIFSLTFQIFTAENITETL